MTHQTTRRKDDHLRITLEEDVSSTRSTGLERYRLPHRALPELSLKAVETATTFLGKRLSFPFIIASMTGGSRWGGELNRRLAEAAQHFGVGMGLGSTRAAIERPELLWTFQVRRYAPDILLLANLGAVQLNYGYDVEACRRIIEAVEADALILHLNPLQEALQPEGDTNFSNLLPKIEELCRALEVPVVVKEVGFGIGVEAARQLVEAGVAAIDVAGAGGTSWAMVEAFRAETRVQREVAFAFRDWGIPTAEAVRAVRAALPNVPLIASGGLRSGLDVAKSLALGADVASMALPLLRAAADSETELHHQLEIIRQQLRVAMFAAGVRDVEALHHLTLEEVE